MKKFRLVVLVPLTGVLVGLSILSLIWSPKGPVVNNSIIERLDPPSRQMRRVLTKLRSGQDTHDTAIVAQAHVALKAAPLDETPFILAGLDHFRSGKFDVAAAMAKIALRRNPRSRDARYLSADARLAVGDVRHAVEDLEVLMRVAPGQRALVLEVISLLASHPEVGKATLAALRDDDMKSAALTALAREGASAEDLDEAIRLTRATPSLTSRPEAIDAITRPLVDAGDFTGAYRVWATLSIDPTAPQVLVRDPRFASKLPAPFGWDIRSGADAHVVGGSEGLIGEVYGRRSTRLARQLLLLPPGGYQLVVEANEPNGLVSTVILCAPAAEIAQLTVEKTGVQSVSFTVPAGCSGQWLEVNARASDPPRAGAFSIQSIQVVGGGE